MSTLQPTLHNSEVKEQLLRAFNALLHLRFPELTATRVWVEPERDGPGYRVQFRVEQELSI